MSSNLGGWEWIGGFDKIKLYPTPCACQKVVVHYLQKCKDWKVATQAMKEGAYAFCCILIGNVRSKYISPPGPGGGMQLNGESLLAKGYELKAKWEEDLIYKFGDLGGGITLD